MLLHEGMKHSVFHQLGADAARQVARRAVDSYVLRYAHLGAAARWTDSDHCKIAFRVHGISLSGLVALLPHEISLELDVPWVLRIFASRAIEVIDHEARSWIARADAVDAPAVAPPASAHVSAPGRMPRTNAATGDDRAPTSPRRPTW